METLSFKLEVKELDDAGRFEGYASVFDVKDMGGDIVEHGAFKSSLKAKAPKGIRMLLDHDPKARVGVWEEMAEDAHGLYAKGRLLIDKQIGREAYIDLKEGALDGLSIGYRAIKHRMDGRKRARMLSEVDLFEVSLVTFPMNHDTRVTAVKSWNDVTTEREFEAFLRDAGASRSEALAIASKGFKAAHRDDAAQLAEMLRRNIERLNH